MNLLPKPPESTAVSSCRSFGVKADGAGRSAIPPSFYFGAAGVVHAASRRWLGSPMSGGITPFMKNTIIAVVMAATILIAGCGKKSSSSSATPSPAQTDVTSSSPAGQRALTAWQQGDKASAVSSFQTADWSARPLFAADSPLNLSESQFKALSEAEREAKSKVMMAQIASLKQMAQAVAQAGHDAASKSDAAQARKYFTSLKQCGTALESPDCMQLVQLVGKAFVKMADTELTKMGQ